jgi:hypothetical protein
MSRPRDVTELLDWLGGNERERRAGGGSIGWRYPCPLPDCDSTDDALAIDIKPNWRGVLVAWVDCRKCPKENYLLRLAEVTGIEPWVIKTAGRWATDRAIAEWQDWAGGQRLLRPVSLARIERLYEVLLGVVEVRRWLVEDRGIGPAMWRRYLLGWDGEALTIPVWDPERRVFFLRRRGWPEPLVVRGKPVKYKTPRGANAQLYPRGVTRVTPSLRIGQRAILCEGELDALVLRGRGLPALTSTAGREGWPDRLLDELVEAGVREAVIVFDADAQASAQKLARRLSRPGIEARAVDLGLGGKGDVTDWFVKYGRTSRDLRRHLKNSQPCGGPDEEKVPMWRRD